MSDFAFRMSSLDRKLSIGEMANPADADYDPEGEEFPDPLDHPEAVLQQYLQNYNSAKRNEEFDQETQDSIDHIHSCMMDFFNTCSNPDLGPDDLPGTQVILGILGTDKGNNGISTFGSDKTAAWYDGFGDLAGGVVDVAKGVGGFIAEHPMETALTAAGLAAIPFTGGLSALPLLGEAGAAGAAGAEAAGMMSGGAEALTGAGLAARGLAGAGEAANAGKSILPGLGKLKGLTGKGLQSYGLGQAMQGVVGGGGGGDGGQGGGVQTTNFDIQPQATTETRFEMPYSHIADNLMFESATSPGPKKRNDDIETLRSQVVAALKAWADSGSAENHAEWWVYFSYAHEASTIAELQTILTAVPPDFHNAVMTSPLPPGDTPTPGETGLPEVTNPAEGSESIATPSPIPMEGIGTAPKQPKNQGLIPGALASVHDELKVRPVFASTDETPFEDYVEEDRAVLAKVAAYLEAGTHEEDVVDTLSPSFGLEYTMWAVEEVKKVASGDPLVDLAVNNLGIEWKTANSDPYQAAREWLSDLEFSDFVEDGEFEDSDAGYIDFNNLNNDQIINVINELYEGGWNQLLKDGFHDEPHFPEKGEHVGQNEDHATNQQADSNMMTPGNEKVAEFTAIPSSSLVNTPAPYAGSYNQTMGLAGQTANVPGADQEVYALGQQAQKAALPPSPGASLVTPNNQQSLQTSQKFKEWQAANPNAHPDWAPPTPAGQGLHPTKTPDGMGASSQAGQVANPAGNSLPSATTSKVAAWKDTAGELLENGKLYKMTSPKYSVPDYVRVVNNGPESLYIHLDDADMDLTLTESQIRQSNYKFEPMEEEKTSKWKVASFLSESGLTTFEQRELINERGVARNLDRLNLTGTHYPTLANFEQTATMEEDEKSTSEDFYPEDSGLFN